MENIFTANIASLGIKPINTNTDRSIKFLDSKGEIVGRIEWNDGEFRFEGNANESAELFFAAVLNFNAPMNKFRGFCISYNGSSWFFHHEFDGYSRGPFSSREEVLVEIGKLEQRQEDQVRFKEWIEQAPDESELWFFKVQDYSTKLVGRRDERGFYVERGDGTKYHYDFDRIVHFEKVS